MNKKGFAISTMLYGLIFVTIAIFYLIINIDTKREESKTNFVKDVRIQLHDN